MGSGTVGEAEAADADWLPEVRTEEESPSERRQIHLFDVATGKRAKGVFGPSEQDRNRQGPVAFAGDLVLVVAVVGGGIIATFVLGDVLPATATTRGVLVVAGCLSLLVLGEYKIRQIATLYRVRPRARKLVDTSGGASTHPTQSS